MTVFLTPPIKYLVIHHTAVSRASGKNQRDAVNTYHKNKNWGTVKSPWYQKTASTLGYYIGYNYFIDVDGSVTHTRAVGEETIAQNGHNCDVLKRCDAISVCISGDFSVELLSDTQITQLRNTLKGLLVKYPQAAVVFHSDIQKDRTCPGKLFTKEYLNTRILQTIPPELDVKDAEKKKQIESLMQQVSVLQKLLQKLGLR